MNKKKKILTFGGIGILIVAIIVLNFTTNTDKATKVNAEAADSRKLIETVSASGRIQPQTKVDITSEITGEIISLYVSEGDYVNKGDLLVVLDTVQLRSDVDQARYALSEVKARLTGFKASLQKAEEDFEIQKKLFEKEQIPEVVFNNAKYTYLNSKANYEATQAQKSQSEARYAKQLDNLSKAVIVPPMNGIITFLDCEVGEIAAAQTAFTQGRTLMTISDLSVFEVEVEIDETEINKIELKQEVEIEVDAFPDTVFSGEVVEIGNTAILGGGTQNQSTNFLVKVVFNDPNVKIRPGMSATVEVTTNKSDNALSIPYSSVVFRNYDMDSLLLARSGETSNDSPLTATDVHAAENESVESKQDSDEKALDLKGVFVIKDGLAQFVEIKTGIADKKNIEILNGIAEGDSVVSGPYRVLRSIKDGELVEIEKKKSEK